MVMNSSGRHSNVKKNSTPSCSQFRILVVGNTGVGKSSLICNIFNVSQDDIDIAHDRIGSTDISMQYTCEKDLRFVLHDSLGFEPGAAGNCDLVKQFLYERSGPEARERIDAIWLCITTPRTGSRLQQTGDENVLALAKKLQIPALVVFTKFDLLVAEYQWKKRLLREDAWTRAEEALEVRLAKDQFPPNEVPWVRISTKPAFIDTLKELTTVTQKCLHDTGSVPWLPMVTDQHVNTTNTTYASGWRFCYNPSTAVSGFVGQQRTFQ